MALVLAVKTTSFSKVTLLGLLKDSTERGWEPELNSGRGLGVKLKNNLSDFEIEYSAHVRKRAVPRVAWQTQLRG